MDPLDDIAERTRGGASAHLGARFVHWWQKSGFDDALDITNIIF